MTMTGLPKASVGGVFFCLFGFCAVLGTDNLAMAQAPQQGRPAQEAPNDLFVTVGKSLIVDSARPIERVSLGLGEIAEAQAVGPQEILVNGKAPGQTSLIIWQQGGEKLFFDVTVQPSRF